MLRDRRVLVVVLAALVVGVPAAVLGTLCFGNACREAATTSTEVPFCSLSPATRRLLAAGFREERSPHVLAVSGEAEIVGGDGVPGAPWPRAEPGSEGTIPLVFSGTGIEPGASVPSGTILDAVAPTIAEAIGLRRPNPGVRSGTALPGVATGDRPRLVLQVVWKGVDRRALERRPERWPVLRGLLEAGAGTVEAEVGSRPLDPTAVMTTIGTGAPPRDHGITGTLVRDVEGSVVTAWSEASPFSVIAGLGDHMDELLEQRPRIGVVGAEIGDRGLIGGTWYDGGDRDDVVLERSIPAQVRAAESLLASGYGDDDDSPDLLAVAMRGSVPALDRALARLVTAADQASGGSALVAVTSTGSMSTGGEVPAAELEDRLRERLGADVIHSAAVGGVFLDQEALAGSGLTDDRVVAALRALEDERGRPLLADAFPALAVTFARYC